MITRCRESLSPVESTLVSDNFGHKNVRRRRNKKRHDEEKLGVMPGTEVGLSGVWTCITGADLDRCCELPMCKKVTFVVLTLENTAMIE